MLLTKRREKKGEVGQSRTAWVTNSGDSSSMFNGSHGDNVHRDNSDDDGCNSSLAFYDFLLPLMEFFLLVNYYVICTWASFNRALRERRYDIR